jgi:SAM-dependent methyltransferase
MLDYYDADFPSALLTRFPENFDEKTAYQGLAHDIARYRALAAREGGRVLEICCGTGRVSIPLAIDGHHVTAVDLSTPLLRTLEENVQRVAPSAAEHLHVVQQDATTLDLGAARFAMAFIAFNSLLCIPSFDAQRRVLSAIARHMDDGALLVLDVVSPLALKIHGDPVATPFFTRRHPRTGNRYTRFAMCSPFDADHVQRLHGWYDELAEDGTVRRRSYDTKWRPIHRFELELMLEGAGFGIEAIEGGHRGEPYTSASPRMFVQARRRSP